MSQVLNYSILFIAKNTFLILCIKEFGDGILIYIYMGVVNSKTKKN